MSEVLKWHYKRVQTEESGWSDDGLADAAGLRVDAEGVVEGPLIRFGLGGRAHVQRAPIGAPEGGGDALLAFEDAAQRGPTGVFAVRAQPGANDLHELVGDDGDEQVAVGPPRLAMVDRTQAELGLQRAEDGLDIGERGCRCATRSLRPSRSRCCAGSRRPDAWPSSRRGGDGSR